MKPVQKLSLLALMLPGLALAAEYEIDPSHSSATFKVRHMMVSNVRGEFQNLAGTLKLDERDITRSSVEATIDAKTINTRDAKRDGHLRSADFFDVEKHPSLTFKSRRVSQKAPGKLTVLGDLTLRGVTKQVTLDVDLPEGEVKDPWGNLKRGAVATTTVNRKDFGLNWNKALEAGGMLVGDEVEITIDLQLGRKVTPVKAKL